jgi:hypothetical protein
MAFEKKVYFKMNAVQFGKIIAYIKESAGYELRFENDIPNAFVENRNRCYEESARWIVRITQFGYEIEDKKKQSKTSFHSSEAVAAYF